MPNLIAHRGQNADFPENTLEAFNAAISSGAKFLEFDVQLTADLIPVISHDISLQKAAGKDIDLTLTSYAELATISAGEPARFGEKFLSSRIPSLQQTLAELQKHPDLLLFIELKQESFNRFGIPQFIDKVLECLQESHNKCVIISFNFQALQYLKKKSAIQCGWIVKSMDKAVQQQATLLSPEFIFINYRRWSNLTHDFSADDWDWVVYETSDPEIVTKLIEKGVTYIETDNISKLLEYFPHPLE